MNKVHRALALAAAVFGLVILASAGQDGGRNGYYRSPAVHRDTVVFVSEGDLWSVDIGGGAARRLTTHHGLETAPAVSPDGSTLAFSAQYEGPTEVYTMPLAGGLPVRRTFAGQTSTVVGWTPDGKILYATQRYSTLPNARLVALDPVSNSETVIPLDQAAEGSYDPAGKTLYFTRLPFQGSYTKRYKGGTVQSLWKFTSGAEALPLSPDYAGTSKNPMFWNGRIYFASDRDGIMNLWSMDLNGKGLEQLTFHKEFDASSPSLHDGRIVYQLVSDLRVYDISGRRDRKIDITLPSDFDQMRERWVSKPLDYLTSAHVSPSGDRIALVSRGHVFVAPAGDGRWVRLTRKEGVRSRSARFFPDGKSLMVLSDESGEWEFHRVPADGIGTSVRLTSGAEVLRYDGLPSPDGRLLAFGDKDQQLWLFDLEKRALRKVAASANGMFRDLAWSPDGRWLAYVETADNLFSRIALLSVETGNIIRVTNDRVDSYSPAWSRDGKWLYFLSDRYFQSVVGSPWGPRQPEPYFDRTTRMYSLGLSGKDVFPFTPANELQAEPKEPAGTSAGTGKDTRRESRAPAEGKEAKAPAVKVVIDPAGIEDRVFEVPLPPGVHSGLAVSDKALFFIDRESRAAGRAKLKAVEIKNKGVEARILMEDVRDFELSQDGKKILVRRGQDLFVIDAGTAQPTPATLAERKIDLSKWTFSVDPRAEWRQMFVDAWRMERDYFYDRNLHNVDYEGLLERYRPFVERVSDRAELNDLIAHLVGELSALHTFVRGGDLRQGADSVTPGSLGARLARDDKAGGYRIEHIYRSDPEYPERSSPLAKPMLGIGEGDIITAIDGVATLGVADPAPLLRNTAGKQVLLEVRPSSGGPAFKAIVYPITPAAEADLRYAEWEYTRRLEVDKAGGGKIGYVHLRAMGGGNYTEWVKNFYPVFDREGLIIDVRHNRGGNIDSWILEKLLRRAWFYWQPRVGNPTWNMQYAFRGHMVVLCNEYTASDGEAFSEGFRRLGLGKIIGTRTWGGEIWLSSSNILVDRGLASAAETGVYGPEGEWLIEGHGVDPDIVIDNLPHETFKGRDAQLEAAVKHLQELIAKEPVEVPKAPPYPDKRRRRPS